MLCTEYATAAWCTGDSGVLEKHCKLTTVLLFSCQLLPAVLAGTRHVLPHLQNVPQYHWQPPREGRSPKGESGWEPGPCGSSRRQTTPEPAQSLLPLWWWAQHIWHPLLFVDQINKGEQPSVEGHPLCASAETQTMLCLCLSNTVFLMILLQELRCVSEVSQSCGDFLKDFVQVLSFSGFVVVSSFSYCHLFIVCHVDKQNGKFLCLFLWPYGG